MNDPTITHVSGGRVGLAATFAAVRALAATFDLAAEQLREWAGLGVRTTTDPALVLSAPLSPVTYGLAEATVLAATTGPDGVLAASVAWERDAVLVREAVALLEAGDERVRSWLLRLDDALVEHAFGLTDPPRHAGLAALAYGSDGHPVVHRTGVPVPGSGSQPGDLGELVGHLQHVAALSVGPDSPHNGTIEVQTLDGGTDRARHIVYLPGTDDIATLPWRQDDDVRDLGTDLRTMGGEHNSYQEGVLRAMAEAGVRPRDPVLLVGHSLGGMTAAAILTQGSRFHVTHVVTAGSPTAQVPGFPAGSHVLSLEHEGDVVPLTDGAPNPASVEQVTVTFRDEGGADGIVGDHDYWHYVNGAAAADASADPAVVEQLRSLQQQGFLAGHGAPPATVTSQVFTVARAP